MFKKIPLISLFLASLLQSEDTFKPLSNYSLYISGGYNKQNLDHRLSPNKIFNKAELDDKGNVFEAGLAYKINKNVFSTISYQKETLDIVDKNNYLVSLNYQLNDMFLLPYLGIIGGYSDLNWDKSPYELQKENDSDSSSFMYGFQIGIEHPIDDEFYIFSKYQAVITDHKMNILYDTNIIEHNGNQNIQIGVRYVF